MRFPFFATNKQLREQVWRLQQFISCSEGHIDGQRTRISDLEQKVLVLEGRVNKLEEAKKHGKKR